MLSTTRSLLLKLVVHFFLNLS